MIDRLLVNVGPDETRIALLDGDRLVELHVDRPGQGLVPGDIVLGVVDAPWNDEWFVNVGKGEPGLVGAHHALVRQPDGSLKPAAIDGVGQVLLVQVGRIDPVKGPRLNVQVRLTGRFLELEPLERGVLQSDRAPEAARSWLRRQKGPPAVVARASAGDATLDELQQDHAALLDTWRRLAEAAREAKPPARLLRAATALASAVRDHAGAEVVCDDGATVAALRKEYGERVRPHRGPEPVFAVAEVEAQLEAALASRIDLPGGGWIDIEGTAALTAIDVNSGGDATAQHANLEAAVAIAAQLRLRDIGGLVVIDFIRGNAAERRRLMRALRQALAGDPAEVRVEGPSPLGLVELSRSRLRPALASHWREPCPTCDGDGEVPTLAAAVAAIRREVARVPPGRPLAVSAAPAVAAAVRARAPEITVTEEPGLSPRGWRLQAG